ncbi:MAG TPA: c-type cytochrome [Thermoanaerobaculia bacterium]|nr:c-type cytochrome [Thermoanaerobaculia bacterium]
MLLRRSILVVLFVLPALANAQPLKNLQILTGISRPELERVMNQMRAGLGVHCHYCHASGEGAESDARPQKARAREMLRMVIDLNARHFGGQPVVTCFTCHNGKPRPALAPPLPQPVPPDEPPPGEVKAPITVPALIQKYIAAIGGREPAPAAPRLFKGTSKSPTGPQVQATIAEVGEKLRVDIQLPDGSTLTRASDAKGGWVRDQNGVRDLQPEDLARVALARRGFAPFHTSNIGNNTRVDSDKLGDRNAWVIVTPTARYWFDAESGLLLRRVVYYDSPIGRMPEQTDFDDYRDVDGVKLPFVVRALVVDPWAGGTRQAESIRVGVPIPPREFEKPSP